MKAIERMRSVLKLLTLPVVALAILAASLAVPAPAAAQVATGAEALPHELRMVVYSAILHIRDVEDAAGHSWPVRLTDQAKAALRDPLGGLQGFSVFQIDVMDVKEVSGSPGLFDVKFLMAMRDDFGRMYIANVYVQYFKSNKGPMVLAAEVIPIIAPQPKLRFYVVPAQSLKPTLSSAPSAAGFFSAVVTNAIPQERLNGAVAGGGEFMVVGLNQFRTPPGDEIRIAVDGDAAARQGFSEGAVVLNFDGWQVGLLPLRIEAGAPAPVVKAFFRSVITARPPHVVASFKLGGGAPGAKAKAAPAPQAAPAATGARMMLNDPGDARKVQQRLKDLGFYAGSVDGKWGASSRTALRQFKSMNGLEDSPIWDDDTQGLLFPD